jgi:BMFP domain-containing protein YqiC
MNTEDEEELDEMRKGFQGMKFNIIFTGNGGLDEDYDEEETDSDEEETEGEDEMIYNGDVSAEESEDIKMSKKEFFKEDITKLFGGASSILGILKEEIEEKIKDRVEKVIFKLEIINKNEFLIVKEMAEKARLENEKLNKTVDLLQKKIALIAKKVK